jgi:type IV pilus assembly protein PilV
MESLVLGWNAQVIIPAQMNKSISSLPKSSGLIMIEVLVSLVIVLFGILGLVGLQARAYQGETEAYQRTQALVLMRAMVDSIESHRQAAPCFGTITTGSGAPYVGTGGTLPTICTATGVAAADQGALDAITSWDAMVKGAGEQAGGASRGAMVNGVGCVSLDLGATTSDPDMYTVAVAWQGLSDLPVAAPANDASVGEKNAAACGTGLFGTASRRRIVWTTIELAKLRS